MVMTSWTFQLPTPSRKTVPSSEILPGARGNLRLKFTRAGVIRGAKLQIHRTAFIVVGYSLEHHDSAFAVEHDVANREAGVVEPEVVLRRFPLVVLEKELDAMVAEEQTGVVQGCPELRMLQRFL